LPPSLADNARTAYVAGEFNNWEPTAHPMKKTKSGKLTLSLELPSGNEYKFRYHVDGTNWETDWEADCVEFIPWAEE